MNKIIAALKQDQVTTQANNAAIESAIAAYQHPESLTPSGSFPNTVPMRFVAPVEVGVAVYGGTTRMWDMSNNGRVTVTVNLTTGVGTVIGLKADFEVVIDPQYARVLVDGNGVPAYVKRYAEAKIRTTVKARADELGY